MLLKTAADVTDQSTQESDRDRWQQPERVMDAIGVKPGMVIGEAGAGTGYFTFKLARRVGETGMVYANDIVERALRQLKDRADREGFKNIKTIVGEVDDPLFPENALDMVMMVYAIHDFERPVAFLENLKRYLKPGASVVILDQDPKKTGDRGHFLTFEKLNDIFEKAGYEFVRNENFLSRDLLCIFRIKQIPSPTQN